MTQLSHQLRERLLATGMSQQAIGQATGLAQSTIGRFLRGVNTLTLTNYERLLALCEAREAEAQQAQS